MSLEGAYERDGIGARVATIRADDRQRRLVIVGGVLLGLGLGSLHWLGLVLGGALVSLPARSIGRGIANGLGLGVLGLVVFGGLLMAQGALGPVLSTGMVGGITALIGLAAPLLGSLVRGLG